MGWRFRRRGTIIPGFLYLNITGHGINSLTIGPPGLKFNISKHGLKITIGWPGTGLFWEKRLISLK